MSVTDTVRRIGRFRLGARIVVGCLILVCSPLVVAWLMGAYDRLEVRRIQSELEDVGALLTRELASRDPRQLVDEEGRAWLDDFGRRHDVFIRVLDAEGHVEDSTDVRFGDGRVNRTWWFARSADVFFGPSGPPDLIGFEAEVGPEHQRAEVTEALETGRPTSTYRVDDRGRMFVFHQTVPAPDGRLLYLARVSRRSARALYDLRFQLLKLTLALAVGGLLMGAWLAWGVVGPIRKLQRRVRRSLADGVAEPLSLTRRDEIGQLSRDFDRLARRLTDRLEHSANVAADFAHDLKNPIAAVMASAELLETDQPLTAERRERIARAVDGAAQHMRRSVDAMLELARVDEALQKEPRTSVDLVAASHEAARGLVADLRHDAITVSIVGDDVAIVGNRARLEELIHNLVANALTFAASRVEVRVAREGSGVTLVVSDDGPGVSEGNRSKIFQRFFSARPDGTPSGSGLGLSIVDAIARAHGGRVELAETPVLGGASFVVHLA